MRVMMTGAAGFLGRGVVDQLAGRGDLVTATDLADFPADTEQVQWRRVDVLNATAVREVVAGHDLVIPLAAKITLQQRDEAAWRLNTEGVRTVARAALAAAVPRLVHCSSGAPASRPSAT